MLWLQGGSAQRRGGSGGGLTRCGAAARQMVSITPDSESISELG
jgi:hypothetical protein